MIIFNMWAYYLICDLVFKTHPVSEILCHYHKHLRVTTIKVGDWFWLMALDVSIYAYCLFLWSYVCSEEGLP